MAPAARETNRARRKVLITGGSGTIGQNLIRQYQHEFEFFSISRNKTRDYGLVGESPHVKSFTADIQNYSELCDLFTSLKPDIVVHAAALKHVNIAEMNPSQTVEVNIIGSLNVARASKQANVHTVIGISTDKACQPENIYGYSKKILEQIFMEHYCESTRFVCARFANVACSQGSVIPLWIHSAMRGDRLKLTDSRMNRLMFTQSEATELIRDAIRYAEQSVKPFVICRSMKSVGMLDLANLIAEEFGEGLRPEIVGIRPGERLNETLVSQVELEAAFVGRDQRNIFLHNDQFGEHRLTQPLSSLTAQYMTADEMRSLYQDFVADQSPASDSSTEQSPASEKRTDRERVS
jgi:FlaA1/EpsC-like NDP-sugar epimerase